MYRHQQAFISGIYKKKGLCISLPSLNAGFLVKYICFFPGLTIHLLILFTFNIYQRLLLLLSFMTKQNVLYLIEKIL